MTKKVTLQVDADEYEFAKRFAKANGYFGTEDFLNGILTSAITKWRDDFEDSERSRTERKHLKAMVRHQDATIQVLRDLLMEALHSKVRQEYQHEAELTGKPIYSAPPVNADDLEDEIPF